MSLGDRIKKLRKSLNYTQIEFGQIIGISGASVSTAESGKTKPDNQTLQVICMKFKVSRDWLENGVEPMYIADDPESPEALIPDIADILREYPALLRLMKTAVRHMTADDWKRFDSFLDAYLKEQP